LAVFEQEGNSMIIDGVEYVRADSVPAPKPSGTRCVMVLDRGWVYAGDVERRDGRVYLTRAVWCFKWSGVGFAGMVADPSKSCDIRKHRDIDFPAGVELFAVPVYDGWGL
jgi:hypothetical protein